MKRQVRDEEKKRRRMRRSRARKRRRGDAVDDDVKEEKTERIQVGPLNTLNKVGEAWVKYFSDIKL